MSHYARLLDESEACGIEVLEYSFRDQLHGLYYDGTIAVNRNLDDATKGCVLAEELGHHFTSCGDISDPTAEVSRRQELRARRWAHELLIPLHTLVDAVLHCGDCERWELADHLGVTDEFLCEALDQYKARYGLYAEQDNYCIYFEPLTVAVYHYDWGGTVL